MHGSWLLSIHVNVGGSAQACASQKSGQQGVKGSRCPDQRQLLGGKLKAHRLGKGKQDLFSMALDFQVGV